VAFCPGCGVLVAHEADADVEWSPVAHAAPCGRPCCSGGVSQDAILLGAVHRGEGCAICGYDSDDLELRLGAPASDWEVA
jgi:hypothetical protein